MNTATNVKKKLSGASIVSIIFAIIFSIAAACMVFLPVLSVDSGSLSEKDKLIFSYPFNQYPQERRSDSNWGDGSTFDISVIGTTGKYYVNDARPYIDANKSRVLSTQKKETAHTLYFVEVIAATAAFFGLIAVAVFVLLGKILQAKKGGRILAVIFSLLGAVIGVGYLVTSILYSNSINDVDFATSCQFTVGIGPILMAAFAVLAAVFCFFGLGRSAFKKTEAAPAPVAPTGFDPSQQAPVQQPVQNYAPVQQPQPVQNYAPVQPVQSAQQVTPPAVSGQKAMIEGIKGEYKGMEIDLEPNEKLVIGRDPASCNIVVSSENKDISRMHCSVWYDPEKDAFKVMDTSSNGTFIGGQKLPKDQKVQVPDNTIISLGGGENQFILRKK